MLCYNDILSSFFCYELFVFIQVLGCLIVELFLACRLRASATSHEQRLQVCQSAARHCGDQLPRCVRQVVLLLLQISSSSGNVRTL